MDKPKIYGMCSRCTFHDGNIRLKETFIGYGSDVVKAHQSVHQQIERFKEKYNTELIDKEDKNFWI